MLPERCRKRNKENSKKCDIGAQEGSTVNRGKKRNIKTMLI